MSTRFVLCNLKTHFNIKLSFLLSHIAKSLQHFSGTTLLISNPITTIKNVIHSYDILAPRVRLNLAF